MSSARPPRRRAPAPRRACSPSHPDLDPEVKPCLFLRNEPPSRIVRWAEAVSRAGSPGHHGKVRRRAGTRRAPVLPPTRPARRFWPQRLPAVGKVVGSPSWSHPDAIVGRHLVRRSSGRKRGWGSIVFTRGKAYGQVPSARRGRCVCCTSATARPPCPLDRALAEDAIAAPAREAHRGERDRRWYARATRTSGSRDYDSVLRSQLSAKAADRRSRT